MEEYITKSEFIRALKKRPTRFFIMNGSFIGEILKYKKRESNKKWYNMYKIWYRTWLIEYHPNVRNKRCIRIIKTSGLDIGDLPRVKWDDYKEILKLIHKYPECRR